MSLLLTNCTCPWIQNHCCMFRLLFIAVFKERQYVLKDIYSVSIQLFQLRRPHFYRKGNSVVLISVRGWVDHMATEEYATWKFPTTFPEIEPGTSCLLAQCLYQLALLMKRCVCVCVCVCVSLVFNSASGRSCATELGNDWFHVINEGLMLFSMQIGSWDKERRVPEQETREGAQNVIAQRIFNCLV
jgi:hypothetical protein